MKSTKNKTSLPFAARWMLGLFTACYRDVACASDISSIDTEFDLKTVESRLAREGTSFFTKALPLLGKQLDRLLSRPDTQQLWDLPFPGWKLQPMSVLPRFLGSLFADVLAPDGSVKPWQMRESPNGDKLASPVAHLEQSEVSGYRQRPAMTNADALGRLRQLLYLFYKVEFPSTSEQNDEVIKSFIETDAALPAAGESMLDRIVHNTEKWFGQDDKAIHPVVGRSAWILQKARAIVHRVLGGEDPLDASRLNPRHGPGSVATGELPHEKPVFRRYYEHLHAVFPYDTFMSYNLSSVNDEWEGWQDLESRRESTAKVVLVPKDSRGPRLISCEPLEIQWIQQALMTRLVKILETHPLTRGYVNFERQDVNRELAFVASMGLNVNYSLPPRGEEWVTMDMKDASDRVSLALVRFLFPQTWVRALEACRSNSTRLPDGRIVELRKHAPMGSATCFPVEALVFWAICVATQQHVEAEARCINVSPFSRRVRKEHGTIREPNANTPYVYGDDLVVRGHLFDRICEALEVVDLKVNYDKCCRGLYFRESCGMDAFQGIDVTPLKVRKPLGLRSHTALFSWCAYHNWFSRRGYERAALWIRQYLAESRDARFLVVLDEHWIRDGYTPGYAYLHVAGERPHALRGRLVTRFNRDTHQQEYLAWGVTSCNKKHHVPGWSEMLRMASYRGSKLLRPSVNEGDRLPPAFEKTLEAKAYEYARAHRVVRKCAWYPTHVG